MQPIKKSRQHITAHIGNAKRQQAQHKQASNSRQSNRKKGHNMIFELLAEGKENARTGRALADILGVNIRDVTATIERERRSGKPICASMDKENPGYYLPETADELAAYCNMIGGRAQELITTQQALIAVLQERQRGANR